LLNLHDTHVTVPWFGPNAWQAIIQPVPGGNLPSSHSSIELKLTFKDGGAPDFHSNFEQIKERLQQAVDAARDSNFTSSSRRGGFMTGVNMDSVHLDQLPTYEASGQDQIALVPAIQPESDAQVGLLPSILDSEVPNHSVISQPRQLSNLTTQETEFEPPTDAPPGYEETQQQSIREELERRFPSND
jgi:WW domain-binding protein 2